MSLRVSVWWDCRSNVEDHVPRMYTAAAAAKCRPRLQKQSSAEFGEKHKLLCAWSNGTCPCSCWPVLFWLVLRLEFIHFWLCNAVTFAIREWFFLSFFDIGAWCCNRAMVHIYIWLLCRELKLGSSRLRSEMFYLVYSSDLRNVAKIY